MYDIVIIGGGPAAITAGIYAARKKMKSVFIADRIGGQSVVSDGIENWIGEMIIPGAKLAGKLKQHLENYKDDILLDVPNLVKKVEKNEDGTFNVITEKQVYKTKTVLVASGGRHRNLNVPGEEKFNGKGVAYCATCDAPFFGGKDVVVVGDGNSGLEAVVDLIHYADKVYLLSRGDSLRGDPVTQEEIKKSDKVEIIYNADTVEITGDLMVEALKYKDLKTEEIKEISTQGVFVEIGTVPNSEIVGELVDLTKRGEIIVNHQTYASSVSGIFAAGDVCDTMYKQNNIAVGDAVKALLSAHEFIKKSK